ncbi:MAG: glycosyltransferase family 2 protein [Nitrospinae bacterium]|nr:glycosyltransferase family 2 protein [Nitrospinota bacterium]
MLVSYIILTRNRKGEVVKALRSVRNQDYTSKEIIVVDNASSDGTAEMIKKDFPDVRYYRMNSNIGACAGRNIGIKEAKGDILIFLDDDAIFEKGNETTTAVNKFNSMPDIDAIAFKVIDEQSGGVSHGVQHGGYPVRGKGVILEEKEVSYFFIGAASFRRRVFEDAGLFHEEYFIYCEEMELSFRMLEKGMRILFIPQIAILHKMSSTGRMPHIYYQLRNRIWIVFKYLPLIYAIMHSSIWLIYLLWHSIKDKKTDDYLKAVIDSAKGLPRILKNRSVLSRRTIKRLKELRGRLYY